MFRRKKRSIGGVEVCWPESIYIVDTVFTTNMAISISYKRSRDILQLEPGYDFVSEAVLGSHPLSSVEQPHPSFNKRQNDA
jgi:hypothetical protein